MIRNLQHEFDASAGSCQNIDFYYIALIVSITETACELLMNNKISIKIYSFLSNWNKVIINIASSHKLQLIEADSTNIVRFFNWKQTTILFKCFILILSLWVQNWYENYCICTWIFLHLIKLIWINILKIIIWCLF